ncbi:MAG: DUF6359 domain-containing protein [Bacteroidales bacterium]
MKTKCLFLIAVAFTACNSLQIVEQSKVRISFAVDGLSVDSYREGAMLKSNNLHLDTNDFILKVYSTEGSKVYDGKYGAKPKDFMVLPGGYDIGLYSGEWGIPKFDQPVFGDTTTVVVMEDSQLNVRFQCRQISGGIKFSFSDDFKRRFPGEGVNIVQGGGKLKYTYQEARYAHVSTDPFTLEYSKNNGDTVLLQKKVHPAQMVNMKLTYTVPDGYQSSFKVQMDTVREWIDDSYNAGLKIPTGAVTIEQAKKMVGEKNVSVFGFIYGGDPTTNSVRIAPPFTSTATLVIALSMGERNRNNSFVVELPSGKIRDALNLVGRPGHLGRAIVVTGEIVPSYFNYIGVKGTKAYKFIQ